MLERARVELIDDLHRLGRQLGVLKRLYQSYQLIVNRIVKRQRRLQEEKRLETQFHRLFVPANYMT
jgi:gluconate kinase